MNITLRQMEYVVAVADEGHFGRAAQSCHVSQPALSRQIAQVEEIFDTQLFERTSKGALLTTAGREFAARARSILEDTRRLVALMQSHGGELRGLVRLGVIPTVAPYFLPGLLGSLRDSAPDLELIVVEEETSRLLDDLHRGELDVVLAATPIERHGTESLDLLTDPFVLVCHAEHSLASEDRIDSEDLLASPPLLLLEEGHCFRDHALEFCTRYGTVEEADVRSTSLSTLLGLVELGRGLTIVPVLAIPRELPGRKRLVARPFSDESPKRTLSLLWRTGSPMANAYDQLGAMLVTGVESINKELVSLGYDALPHLELCNRDRSADT